MNQKKMFFLLYLLVFNFIFLICKEPPYLNVNTVKFDEFTLVHNITQGTRSRKIFKDPATNLYFKIWCKDYILAPDFINAVKAGYFDKIARIKALLIDDDGYCCGYVTPEGQTIFSTDIVLEENNKKALRFANASEQTFATYNAFYNKLIKAAAETKFVFIDLTPSNIILLDNTLYLIDLESVRKINSLNDNFFQDEYLPKDYRQAIARLKGVNLAFCKKDYSA